MHFHKGIPSALPGISAKVMLKETPDGLMEVRGVDDFPKAARRKGDFWGELFVVRYVSNMS